MIHFALFRQATTGFQIILFIFLLLFSALISMLVGILVCALFFQLPVTELLNLSLTEDGIDVTRTIQIISQMGVIIIPPIVYSFLIAERPFASLGFTPSIKPLILITGIVVMFSLLPVINQVAELNKAIELPTFLKSVEQWMLTKEQQAEAISLQFLEVTSLNGLLLNLLMIGILPAVGEELVFRSVLQPLIGKMMGNVHAGIIISAVLFSAMHLQFYGFFPRLGLGVLLGYFYVWSGTIVVPMLMHFVNNATAVIVFYLAHNGMIATKAEEFGTSSTTGVLLMSGMISLLLIYFAYRHKR